MVFSLQFIFYHTLNTVGDNVIPYEAHHRRSSSVSSQHHSQYKTPNHRVTVRDRSRTDAPGASTQRPASRNNRSSSTSLDLSDDEEAVPQKSKQSRPSTPSRSVTSTPVSQYRNYSQTQPVNRKITQRSPTSKSSTISHFPQNDSEAPSEPSSSPPPRRHPSRPPSRSRRSSVTRNYDDTADRNQDLSQANNTTNRKTPNVNRQTPSQRNTTMRDTRRTTPHKQRRNENNTSDDNRYQNDNDVDEFEEGENFSDGNTRSDIPRSGKGRMRDNNSSANDQTNPNEHRRKKQRRNRSTRVYADDLTNSEETSDTSSVFAGGNTMRKKYHKRDTDSDGQRENTHTTSTARTNPQPPAVHKQLDEGFMQVLLKIVLFPFTGLVQLIVYIVLHALWAIVLIVMGFVNVRARVLLAYPIKYRKSALLSV